MRRSAHLLNLCLLLLAAFHCLGQTEASTSIRSDAAHLSAAEVHTFLEMICPGRTSASGCEVCPEGTASPVGPWELRSITFGHFLSPASDDVLISGFECESHAEGYSGSFLFTRDQSSWKKVRYEEGVKAWDCRKLAGSDGRDRLVCAAQDVHQGYEDAFLYVLDPGRDPRTMDPLDDTSRGSVFFYVMDGLGALCVGPRNDDSSQHGTIARVDFQELPKGRQVRITVYASLGKADVPDEVIERACRQTGFPTDLKIATLPRQYEFTFDGARVIPAQNNPPTKNRGAIAPQTSYQMAN